MWQNKDGVLYREFKFANFDEAFAFMNAVAKIATKQDHHPRWQNDYNRVEIWLTTHSSHDKITDKDRQLALAIDLIYGA